MPRLKTEEVLDFLCEALPQRRTAVRRKAVHATSPSEANWHWKQRKKEVERTGTNSGGTLQPQSQKQRLARKRTAKLNAPQFRVKSKLPKANRLRRRAMIKRKTLGLKNAGSDTNKIPDKVVLQNPPMQTNSPISKLRSSLVPKKISR